MPCGIGRKKKASILKFIQFVHCSVHQITLKMDLYFLIRIKFGHKRLKLLQIRRGFNKTKDTWIIMAPQGPKLYNNNNNI